MTWIRYLYRVSLPRTCTAFLVSSAKSFESCETSASLGSSQSKFSSLLSTQALIAARASYHSQSKLVKTIQLIVNVVTYSWTELILEEGLSLVCLVGLLAFLCFAHFQ